MTITVLLENPQYAAEIINKQWFIISSLRTHSDVANSITPEQYIEIFKKHWNNPIFQQEMCIDWYDFSMQSQELCKFVLELENINKNAFFQLHINAIELMAMGIRTEKNQTSGSYKKSFYNSSEMDQAYKTLGISKHASSTEITKKWKMLTRQNHPDKCSGSTEERKIKENKMKEINNSFEIIKEDLEKCGKWKTNRYTPY